MLSFTVLLSLFFALVGLGLAAWAVVYWIRTRPLPLRSLFANTVISGYIHIPSPKPVELKNLFDPMRSATIQEIVKGSQDLEGLVIIDKAHEEVYRKIISDKVLIEQIRNAGKKEAAQQILREWLNKQKMYGEPKQISQKPTAANEKTPAPATNTAPAAAPVETDKTKGKGKASAKTTAPQPQPTEQKQPEKIPQTPAKPLPVDGERAHQKIASALNEENMIRLIDVITDLPANVMQILTEHYTVNQQPSENSIETSMKQIFASASSKDIVLNNMREEIIKILQLRYESLQDDMRILRKKGVNMKNEEITLMKAPLKIKVFSATFAKEDYERVMEILFEVKENVEKKKVAFALEKK